MTLLEAPNFCHPVSSDCCLSTPDMSRYLLNVLRPCLIFLSQIFHADLVNSFWMPTTIETQDQGWCFLMASLVLKQKKKSQLGKNFDLGFEGCFLQSVRETLPFNSLIICGVPSDMSTKPKWFIEQGAGCRKHKSPRSYLGMELIPHRKKLITLEQCQF